MARILVTGGAGYIGSHTVHHLLRRGYEVVVVDNLSRGHRENVAPEMLREIDIADGEALAGVFAEAAVDAVIHFAGLIAVGESNQKPELYFWNNVAGSLSLFRAMADAGVKRIVFSSSAAVYGTPDAAPIGERAPLRPMSAYGETKLAVERALLWLDQNSGVRSISLRYFNACGAEPGTGLGERHIPETHLIPLLFRAAMTGEPVTIFGDDYQTLDGSCIRDYVHVSDLATAHLAALERLLGGCGTEAMNVGTGRGHSVWEVLRTVEEVIGKKVPFQVGARRAGDPPVLVADSTKIKQALDWKPRYLSLHEIVKTAWEFETGSPAGWSTESSV